MKHNIAFAVFMLACIGLIVGLILLGKRNTGGNVNPTEYATEYVTEYTTGGDDEDGTDEASGPIDPEAQTEPATEKATKNNKPNVENPTYEYATDKSGGVVLPIIPITR